MRVDALDLGHSVGDPQPHKEQIEGGVLRVRRSEELADPVRDGVTPSPGWSRSSPAGVPNGGDQLRGEAPGRIRSRGLDPLQAFACGLDPGGAVAERRRLDRGAEILERLDRKSLSRLFDRVGDLVRYGIGIETQGSCQSAEFRHLRIGLLVPPPGDQVLEPVRRLAQPGQAPVDGERQIPECVSQRVGGDPSLALGDEIDRKMRGAAR
jgi:hypothetical protein